MIAGTGFADVDNVMAVFVQELTKPTMDQFSVFVPHTSTPTVSNDDDHITMPRAKRHTD